MSDEFTEEVQHAGAVAPSKPTTEPTQATDHMARILAIDHAVKTGARVGVFLWGCVFLSLGVVDGVRDAFDASAFYFGATGASLVIGAITGRVPKAKNDE